MKNPVFAIALIGLFMAGSPASAGDVKVEADRCRRWLEALFHENLDQAASIATEQLRPGDVPEVYLTAQRDNVKKLHDILVRVASSEPSSVTVLNDVVVEETGDILKLQVWEFRPGLRAYVGCVSYPGKENPWHLVVKFEDDLEQLKRKLQDAARSRLTSPPERNTIDIP